MDEFDEEGDDMLLTMAVHDATDVMVSRTSSQNCVNDNHGESILIPNNHNWLKTNIYDKNVTPTDSNVRIPEEFPFPFKPYDIQLDFMKHLYRTLELGKIGIFESPTGTGKSLSLICGTVQWLKDFKEREKERLENLIEGKTKQDEKENNSKPQTEEDSRLSGIDTGILKPLETPIQKKRYSISERDFHLVKVKQKQEEEIKLIEKEKEQLMKCESQLAEMKKYIKPAKRKREKLENEFDLLMKGASNDVKEAYESELENLTNDENSINTVSTDEHLILNDYHSDDEGEDRSENADEGGELHVTKIYYCSRTHSQLSQFVREVIKSPFGDDTSVVSLGSRQNMCINESVRRLKSLSLMNDKCLELKRNKSGTKTTVINGTPKKKSKGEGCPYHKIDEMQDFRNKVLVDVQDVEQLVTMAKEMKACPYYGTRLAIPAAEIVTLPYNTLLHKSTREACGIKLKDQIVIIDEAHNLLETINNIYSVKISGAQTMRAYSQLKQYETKFRSRLKAKNLMYVKQILHVLSSCVKYLGGKLDISADKQFVGKSESRLLTINDFLFETKLDNINLFKVLRYCSRSEISKKLHGFVEKYQPCEVVCSVEKEEENSKSGLSKFLQEIKQGNIGKKSDLILQDKDLLPPQEEITLNSPLMHIEGLFEALTNADKDGRIVVSRNGLLSQSKLKFLLLNPAVHFTSVLNEARAIIVAGGTMQPISDFKDQLFYSAGVQSERITEFSCGHVIPSDNLLPVALSSGPSGRDFDFTYQSRDNPQLLDELGRTLINICNLVPGGIVCFFPSYDYEKLVYSHWESKGFLMKISSKKKIVREPKRAGQVDQILDEYSNCIQKCSNGTYGNSNITGSLLLSVVGGKMSEGINFSDELGRCIIMVGLPYPNIRSPELKEKMDYLNANYPKSPDGKLPGQIHYENLCMKAVNQSIGRAIRHRGDYACVLLLDRRFHREGTSNKLPHWISKLLRKETKFGQVISHISKFFASKNTTRS